jgi:riboflavin kinase/FMN adenylyltransferase
MQIVRGLESYPPEGPESVVALGVFDGVHLGHRAILGTAVARAREGGRRAIAFTFDPHPMDVLHPESAPPPITTLEERLDLIAALGLDATIVCRFGSDVAAIEPEAFIRDSVVARLHALEIVVGFNHRFGRGARGDARLLGELGERLGFRAHVVPPLVVDGSPVSSRGIRTALREGDVARAARWLGRDYVVGGKVVRGAGRGRALGFPTANLEPDRPPLVPLGVYAGRATVHGTRHSAVANIGRQPTFGENAVAIEVHLLDFTGDTYGAHLDFAFAQRLRGEQKFSSVDALRAQIARDIGEARRVL